MQAAVQLSAEKGFQATRISDIVGEVGVGQGVFYWYFESKEALFGEIVTDLRRRLRRFQASVVGREADALRRIALGIWSSLDFLAHNAYVFGMFDPRDTPPRRRPPRPAERTASVHVADLETLLSEAMGQGLVRKGDPEVLALNIVAVCDRTARVWLSATSVSEDDIDAAAQTVIDFCLGGLQGVSVVDVQQLRSAVHMTEEMLDLRNRVGSLGPQSMRLRSARAQAAANDAAGV